MIDTLFYNKRDKHGEYAEFTYPTEPVELKKAEAYRNNFKWGIISPLEKRRYYHYLLANIEHGTKEEADEVFRHIISTIKQKDDIEDVIFVGLYTLYLEYKKAKYDKDGKVKKGYEELQIPSLKIYHSFSNPDTQGVYDEGSKKIAILKKRATTRNMMYSLNYIFALCHEARHYLQEYEMQHGLFNETSLAYLANDRTGIFASFNYHCRTIENDANEHAFESVIEIIKKYIVPAFKEMIEKETGKECSLEEAEKETEPYIYRFKDQYDLLRKGKVVAVSTIDFETALTDVSDIGFILNEAQKLKENNQEQERNELLEKLRKLGALPKIFLLDSEGRLVLQSEKSLLVSYFSVTDEAEKTVYEKALKYMYTFNAKNKNDFVKEDTYYKTPELKLRFIEEQLEKERKYLEQIREMKKDRSIEIATSLRTSIWEFIHEIISVRLKRIQYYTLVTSAMDNTLHQKSEILFDEFLDLYLYLLAYLNEKEENKNVYQKTNTNYDFSNKLAS